METSEKIFVEEEKRGEDSFVCNSKDVIKIGQKWGREILSLFVTGEPDVRRPSSTSDRVVAGCGANWLWKIVTREDKPSSRL